MGSLRDIPRAAQRLASITAIVLLSACASDSDPGALSERDAQASAEEGADTSANAETVPDAGPDGGETAFTGEASCTIQAELAYTDGWSNRDVYEWLFPTRHAFEAKITGPKPEEVRVEVGDAGVSAWRSLTSAPAYRSFGREGFLIDIQPPIVQAPTRLDAVWYGELRFTISGRELSGEASAAVRFAHLDYVGSGRPAKAKLHCELSGD